MKQLLIKTQERAGIAVKTRGDCERLSALVEEETGETLSYNTLRRMYGLASQVRPHKHTLDVLSRFCGFRDYAQFSMQDPKLSFWQIQNQLHISLANSGIDSVVEVLHRLPKDLNYLSLWLDVCRTLFHAQRWEDLLQFLDRQLYLPELYGYSYQLHVSSSLGSIVSRLSFGDVLRPIMIHPAMVEGVYLRLVDYSALNGYYGDWTSLVEASKPSTETKAFIQCLRMFKGFLNGERFEMDTSAIALDSCPPPLLGRLFSVDVLQSNVWDSETFDNTWGT